MQAVPEVRRAEQFILQVARERVAHGITEHDQDTLVFGALLVAEIEQGHEAEFNRALLQRIYHGAASAEMLAEDDCDEERAAIDVPYGNHVGDYVVHLN